MVPMIKVFIFALTLISSISSWAEDDLDQLKFDCKSKINGEACFKVAEIYKGMQKYDMENLYLDHSCINGYQKGCETIKGYKETTLEQRDAYDKLFNRLDKCRAEIWSFPHEGFNFRYSLKPLEESCKFIIQYKDVETRCDLTSAQINKIRAKTEVINDLLNYLEQMITDAPETCVKEPMLKESTEDKSQDSQ